METLFIYIIKSSGLMLLFYCTYFFLLRKETFFHSNRWFLLSGLLVSVILPMLNYTKIVWIDATPNFTPDFSQALQELPEANTKDFAWSYLVFGLYVIGFIVLLIKLAIDFYSLNKIIKGKRIQQQADFKFIDIKEKIAPFSYFEYIVYNSSLYTASELENIIEHEKVHSDQNHTVDVLISRIFSIVFWFNPIVWLYKKAITQNLEFIADSEASKKLSDKKAYQYTLLKITTHENCVAITNHFYQSLIKKRIVMLNKNQSKRRNSWKYYAVIPALVTFILLFQIEVVAKERQQTVKVNSKEIESIDVYKIKKSSTDSELKGIKEKLKSIHNIDFMFSDIKRNSENELTSIKVDVINGKEKSQSIQTGDKTIKDFGIIVITDKDGKKKAGIHTNNEKIVVSKKLTSNDKTNSTETKNTTINTETNVNTNSITSTKTNSDTNSNISTIIVTGKDSNNTSIAVSNATKTNAEIGSLLVIVNGEEMPMGFDINSIANDNIESISVFKGTNATSKYGNKAANGAIEIETKN